MKYFLRVLMRQNILRIHSYAETIIFEKIKICRNLWNWIHVLFTKLFDYSKEYCKKVPLKRVYCCLTFLNLNSRFFNVGPTCNSKTKFRPIKINLRSLNFLSWIRQLNFREFRSLLFNGEKVYVLLRISFAPARHCRPTKDFNKCKNSVAK